ncbi:cutinase family protein [Nocardia sp. NPDC050175]|uniref:cutinase family protein n=1 Tax=Nocardia sp. NPDC050175 TaxID=3364317 RepID=UPI0037BA1C55
MGAGAETVDQSGRVVKSGRGVGRSFRCSVPMRLLAGGAVCVIGFGGAMTGAGVAVGSPWSGGGLGGSDCPSVAGVFLPGTWETNARADETQAVGLLAPVATRLAEQFGDKFVFRFPAYAAAAFNGMAYGNSKATGVSAARQVIEEFGQRCGATKFVLAGYSQGADALGDLAASIGCSGDPVSADRVLAVGLIADPRQGTNGGKLVGPQVEGEGIAGPRPGGFCALSAVTAEICAQQDKYCATNASTNPVLAGLGRILSQPVGSVPGATEQEVGSAPQLVESLISDVGNIDLPGLQAGIEKIVASAGQGQVDADDVSAAVRELQASLGPLGELASWAKAANPEAGPGLSKSAAGSPQRLAGDVVGGLARSDLPAALNSLSELAGSAAGTPAGDEQSAAASRLASATAPLTESMGSSSPEALSQASRALGILKPSVVVGQVSNVATNGLAFVANVPAIVDTVSRIGAAIMDTTDVAAKVSVLHGLFGELNTLFRPLVVLADGVDLRTVSQLVAMIPDTSGTAQTASVLVGLLDNLNVVALARQVGRLQEDLWGIAEAITKGGNPIEVGTRLVGLVPTMLGFASLAVDTLTGTVSHSSEPGASAPSGAGGLGAVAQQLSDSLSGQDGDALAQLTSDGVTAANFFASGVHRGYEHYLVDGQRNAVDWLTDWFSARIRNVAGVV